MSHDSENPDSTEQFLTLYNREHRRLYVTIRALMSDRADADDVFQETCLALWKHFAEFTPGTNFSAWASQIARNRVLAFCKKRKRNVPSLSPETLSLIATDLGDFDILVNARQIALEECLEKMPPKQRELIRRRYQAKTTTSQLAEQIGQSVHVLYKLLQRLRKSLLQCVENRLAAESKEV
jgi:RNA polymerase sigma-70 factor (ECF subfamily)